MRDKKLVLVVDDEDSVVELFDVVLKSKGYDVEMAYDGVAAWKSMEKRVPDLMILDIMMPRMNGWELLNAVRQSERVRELPVLMCSQRDMLEDVERAESLGARGYITKPFEIYAMLSKVDKILGEPSLQ